MLIQEGKEEAVPSVSQLTAEGQKLIAIPKFAGLLAGVVCKGIGTGPVRLMLWIPDLG